MLFFGVFPLNFCVPGIFFMKERISYPLSGWFFFVYIKVKCSTKMWDATMVAKKILPVHIRTTKSSTIIQFFLQKFKMIRIESGNQFEFIHLLFTVNKIYRTQFAL